mmetsp:Transcript_8008/g.20483  ORF Transcript_8008/g.20483 Transcript_8008/m.20483 type:complete len:95 (-) Transcript_8008:377-661(-)
MAMAKKGLSNMAITACYAGPVFNMLVGIGVGFATLLSAEGKHSTPVELSPGLLAGLSFLITNCILLIGFGVSLRPWSPRWHYRNTLHATYRAKR